MPFIDFRRHVINDLKKMSTHFIYRDFEIEIFDISLYFDIILLL